MDLATAAAVGDPAASSSEQDVGSVNSGTTASQASQKSASKSTNATATTSTASSSAATTIPSPPISPSSLARRRRPQLELSHAQRSTPLRSGREGSPLFVLRERRPPSLSTVTNLSESVSYSSSDGEGDHHRGEPRSSFSNIGEEDAAQQSRRINDHPIHNSSEDEEAKEPEEDPFATSDVEMGVGIEPNDGMDPLTPPSSSSSAFTGPVSLPSSPQHWRRPPPHRQRFHTTGGFSPAGPPSVTSSISSSSFRSRRNRTPAFDVPSRHSTSSTSTRNNSSRHIAAAPTAASQHSSSPSLRASLDAGMAAVRTWIRSRGGGSSSNNTRTFEPVELARPRSRSVTWQTAPRPHSADTSSASMASQNSEELDDLLQLDDLSTYTNNSARTDDSSGHLSSTASTNSSRRHRPASAPTILPYPRHHRQQVSRGSRTWSIQQHYSHPDTILEELDEGAGGVGIADGLLAPSHSRKRSSSEPDGRRVPDFFLGPAPSTRYHHSGSRGHATTPRQRRRQLRSHSQYHATPMHDSPRPQYGVGAGAGGGDFVPNSGTSNNVQQSPFSRRISLSRRPRVENDGSASLSSSAAAALDSQQNVSQSSLIVHEFSDAGASVATTATVAAESAIELTVTHHNEHTPSSTISPISPSPGDAASSSFRSITASSGGAASVAPEGEHATTQATASASATAATAARSSPATLAREGSARSGDGAAVQVTDAERQSRIRWIRINRRFQFVITVVALLFSLLLFGILICWVVLTSAYVLSFDKSCDVPLKRYFWLVTLQLVLDVFRSDIMRFVFQWDANSNQRIPARVIAYNVTYLIYALLVLRLGVRSVFIDSSTCRNTAPELFNASTAFVSLSIAAWTTIVCGYLLPFCVVAALLTCNGYNPTSQNRAAEEAQPVFPAAYSTTGAPPGTIDRLAVVRLESIVGEASRECCICMEDFTAQDLLVETACKHVFHKQCCREWLRQARTCPVCRSDIPSGLQASGREEGGPQSSSRIPIGPTGRPVVGLVQMLRRTTGAIARTMSTSSPGHAVRNAPTETRTAGG